ncbi:MarR family transcriptional regulator [soil metagenome]
MNHSDILESLIVSSNRLVRIAAQGTGSDTPSAVWRTLSILETEGAMRIGELAAASRITQPGMTRILATMVEDELVSRIAVVEDSRAWLIDVTAKGREALLRWRKQLSASLEPRFTELDDEQWSVLAQAAQLMASRTLSDAAVAR